MNRPAVRDAALLLIRVIIGLVFVAHGWDVFFGSGITETTGQFSAWHVPQPELSAWLAGIGQLIGGALLVVGLLTTFVAGLLALLILAAFYFVHLDNGVFATNQGFEYPLVMLGALLIIIVFGSGRASVDRLLAA